MRIDTGSMMQGQLRTDIPDLQALTEGMGMGQTDFFAALGQASEGNLFVQNDDIGSPGIFLSTFIIICDSILSFSSIFIVFFHYFPDRI